MSGLKRIGSFLSRLSEADYPGLPKPFSSVINYGLDSYFSKLTEFYNTGEPKEKPPADPASEIKELWLGCDSHKFFSLNKSYPSFARSLTAYAFAMLMYPFGGKDAPYQVVPFLDGYKWKDLIKNFYEFKIQQEGLRLSNTDTRTLPVFGTFFVLNRTDNTHLIVVIDLCYDSEGCKFTVMSSPQHKQQAENFISHLDASRATNDIYYKKCLSFESGVLDFIEPLNTRWDEIVVKPSIKQEILDNSVCILENVDKLQKLGMSPSRNCLLISPPGMAKTSIFRAISSEAKDKTTVIWCTGKSIKNADDVMGMFQAARTLSPCIVLIEDMDLFGRDRAHSTDNLLLNEFLSCLDGVSDNSGVVILASTNDVDSMDEALVNRPGRFDVKVEMPYPDAADRLTMINTFCNQFNAKCTGRDLKSALKQVIDLTDGLTGAYIKDLVKSAVIAATIKNSFDSDGNCLLTGDDLLQASESIMKNFKIGQRASKHHTSSI
jgi:cell division protease FtsH